MTTDDVWREFSAAIKKRRLQIGLRSQQELADKAGVSLATITRFENGKPHLRRSWTWDEVEKALELPPNTLDRWASSDQKKSTFVVEVDDISKVEPEMRSAIKDALMLTLPDVTVSRVLAAEDAIIDVLRDKKLLPH